jgi:hypothetical protein
VSTFYLDASIPIAVREAIAKCRDDIRYAGGPKAPPEETRDQAWLEEAGQEEWVVIFRDKKIRKRPGERRALRAAGVRAFCLTSDGNATRWDTLSLLVSRWQRIQTVSSREAGPYIYAVTQGRFERLDLS